MDCSLPDSSVHRILQARILEYLPFPPEDLPEPGIELEFPAPPALAGGFFTFIWPGRVLVAALGIFYPF